MTFAEVLEQVRTRMGSCAQEWGQVLNHNFSLDSRRS